MSNLIHLDCMTMARVKLIFGQDATLDKEQSDVRNALASLKIFDGFKKAFMNDFLTRSE